MHNPTSRSANARDIYEWYVLEQDRTVRAISRFAYEYCLDAYQARKAAESLLQKELVNA